MARQRAWQFAWFAVLVAAATVDTTGCAKRYIPGIAANVTRPDVYSAAPRGGDTRTNTVEPVRNAPPAPTSPQPRVVRPSSAKPATAQPIGTSGADFVGPQLPAASSVTVTNTPGSPGRGSAPIAQSHSVTMRSLRRSAALPIGAALIAAVAVSAVWIRRRHRIPQ